MKTSQMNEENVAQIGGMETKWSPERDHVKPACLLAVGRDDELVQTMDPCQTS